MNLEKALSTAKQFLEEKHFSNINLRLKKCDDFKKLKISKKHNDVLIEYGELSLVFRALSILKEKDNEECFEFIAYSKFETRGVMVDCSRNGVLKNEKVKELILICALMGLNRFFLYTEDTFKLEKYPYFGYLRGGYSKEDLKEFVEYGNSFGVELIPCIQTLGHLRQVLKWAPMDEFRDGLDTLFVDSPKVYEFIEEMIKTCRDCFTCKDIHIGMDESFEMGLCKHFLAHGYQDRVEMFSRHLEKVKQICHKYDFTPMIWSDMYFRLNSKDQSYYLDSPLPKETLDLVSKDVKLIYWDYYHEKEEDYAKMIRYHKDTSNPVVFGGGSWRWTGFAPVIDKSIEYTKEALKACLKEDVKDIMITAWGDDGNECSFFTILPVLAELSVMNFGDYNEKELNSLLVAISGDSLDDYLTMDLPNKLVSKKVEISYNPSKYLLYQDILLGLFDKQVKDDFGKKYKEFAGILLEKAKKSKKYGYVYLNLANLCDVLSIKANLGVKIRKAYQSQNKQELRNLVNDIDLVKQKFDKFESSFREQWMIECKPFGYEVIDGRFGVVNNRLLATKKRILNYLDGKIDRIEELDETILPFDGRTDEVSWGLWYRIISPSN